ncbi:hypothetical protein Y032_0045g1146 [Ancylostoma ceylanicum]|uniref:Uncharacterized protein n=1 Tax=Ancylostoma ceylanicum TaxID=53326 RepID=A0A016UCK5_9BILA|nr:hypothetical protein Y032_0045g1146 [Ancylostoma ceylanicum]
MKCDQVLSRTWYTRDENTQPLFHCESAEPSMHLYPFMNVCFFIEILFHQLQLPLLPPRNVICRKYIFPKICLHGGEWSQNWMN